MMINRISDSPISNLGLTLMNISSIYNWSEGLLAIRWKSRFLEL